MRLNWLIIGVLACACWGTDVFAEATVRPIQAGLEPQAAADNMTALEGFRVELAAGEPMVHQPIAMAIDDRGRMWVAEAHTYPIRAEDGKGRDKIVILEDTNRDGRFDDRKVFAEGLNLVSGLELGFGGVWVGAAPYLMFIPDRDGNDVPDTEPQVLLDGFGYEDTHETLNAFIWGPDGWLYGCHGVFTHSRVGKPGAADEHRIPMNAAVWRYHPTRHQFEVFSWGTSNPWGVDFNDQGHAFITACVIPHLYHIVQGARYQRQGGQHFDRYFFEDIQTIAQHRHYTGDIRDHAWWGAEPEPPADTLAAGGGHAHCGAMIYLGDNWPSPFRNQIFMHNVHGNRVNQDHLERRGSGYTGSRAPDLMLANDKWFRGINLKYVADGSVYLIDWYDRNACHRTNPEIWDRTNGRIYRIVYGQRTPEAVHLGSLGDRELAELQLHANDWYVRMARRLLQERAAEGKLNADTIDSYLWQMAQSHDDPTRRLRALWTLHATGLLDDERRLTLLSNEDESVRSWAIQLEFEDGTAEPRFLAELTKLAAADSSSLVRLYLSSALQRMDLENRWDIAEGLVSHAGDAEDHNLPKMIWYGIEPLVTLDPARALALADKSQIPLVREFIYRRGTSDDAACALVVDRLAKANPTDQSMILEQMLEAFAGQVGMRMPDTWQAAYDVLLKSDNASVRDRADEVAILFGDQRVFPSMRQRMTNRELPLEKRRAALDILVRGQDRQAASSLLAILADPELRGPAIRALANLGDHETPQALLDQYAHYSAEEKRDAIGTLTSRPEFARIMLDAIAAGKIPTIDLHAYNVRQIQSLNDKELNERVRQVWGEIRETSANKQEMLAKFKKIAEQTEPPTNPSRGRRVFVATCANCHKLFGEGGEVGPDITGSNRANLDYILENVLDPSAVLGKDYRMTVLELADGRVVSGLVKQETESALTVRTLNDTVLIAKSEIETRELSELSMMPEGLLDRMEPSDVRDLLAYLASPTQVSARGMEPPIDSATGRIEGGLEGETLKIVDKTAGTAASQLMDGFKGDRWSGNDQLWWTGAKSGDRLAVAIPVAKDGNYLVQVVLTQAPDYAIVQLKLDDQKLGEPIDLYAPEVRTTGLLDFGQHQLSAGEHRLTLEVIGSNAHATPSHMVGLDCVILK